MFHRVPGFCNPQCIWPAWTPFSKSWKPGATVGDGYRKSWGLRAPMIQDKFAISRTNCASLTDDINPRRFAHVVCSRSDAGSCSPFKAMNEWMKLYLTNLSAISQRIRTRVRIFGSMLWDLFARALEPGSFCHCSNPNRFFSHRKEKTFAAYKFVLFQGEKSL